MLLLLLLLFLILHAHEAKKNVSRRVSKSRN